MKTPTMKLMAIATVCAAAVAIGGCGKNEASKQDKPIAESQTPAIDQAEPLAVAKAFWTAATEEDADTLLALTAEEEKEEVKNELVPHLKEISAEYKGKTIDVGGEALNAPAIIREKDGKKYARVHVVLAAGTKEASSQTLTLVLKEGKWFATSNRLW